MLVTPGRPLLPHALQGPFRDIPVRETTTWLAGTPSTLSLGDLDESVWQRYPESAIRLLAHEVIYVLTRPLPASAAAVRVFVDAPLLNELGVTVRTWNALSGAGLVKEGRVMPTTVGELARIPQLGARSLLEALFADERAAGTPRRVGVGPSPAVRRITHTLTRKKWATRVHRTDPRLGPLLIALDPDAETAADAAATLAGRTYTPAEARRTVAAIRAFIHAVDVTKKLLLEQEIDDIVTALTPRDSAKQVVLARTGLSGSDPVTLEDAGRVIGVTRERARQIERRFRDQVADCHSVWTPVLERALRAAADLAPVPDARLSEALVVGGTSSSRYASRSLLLAANLFGKEARFAVREDGCVMPEGHWPPDGVVGAAAQHLVAGRGIASLPELADKLRSDGYDVRDDLLRVGLENMTGFSWLDRESGWFWVRTTHNRLLNQVLKIVSVAGAIDLGQLRAGVGRHHRTEGFRPRKHILAELCRQAGYRVDDGERVVGPPDLPDWRVVLGANERLLVDVLFAEGPVMRRDDLERHAVGERGLNRASFYAYLSYSPIIERYAAGVYGLRGAPVTAAKVDALIPPRVRHHVLQDHGWTTDGDVWAVFRVSPASVSTGVLTTPTALRPAVAGNFRLLDGADTPVGKLVVQQNMWGLGPFFRSAGVEAGDHVAIVWNIRERRATIRVGDRDLLFAYQSGE